MKTPEETKNLLAAWGTGVLIECGDGTYKPPGIWQGTAAEVCTSALELIQQLETSYSKVSKALCGKENASLEEVLQEVRQVKSRLAQVERERDAALSEWKRTKMNSEGMCWTCKHGFITDIGSCRCVSPLPCYEGENWEWRGSCEENTKEDANA